MRRKRGFIVAIMIAALVILTACRFEANDWNGVDAWTEIALFEENRNITSAGNVCPSAHWDGYYVCTNTINYYDTELGEKITLCSQTGCNHSTELCEAWIGDVGCYTEYRGKIYAITSADDAVRFVCKNVADGKISVLLEWKNTKNEFYEVSISKVSDGLVLLYLESRITEPGCFMPQTNATYLLYDLERETSKDFLNPELEVLGFSSNYAAILYRLPEQEQLLEYQFKEQYGEEYSYGRYLHRSTKYELRLYDMATEGYTVIASTEKDGFIRTVDPCVVYDKLVAYQSGDTMHLLDLDTGESRAVVTAENIVNYWVMDEKIFLITSNMDPLITSHPDREVSIHYADFEDGELVKLENDGRTDVMAFGINQEGATFFIGLWNDGTYLISKEDFYADRYENARKIG